MKSALEYLEDVMAIKKDLSHLTVGAAPDPEPRFAPLLLEAWAAKAKAEGERPFALDTRLRHSWAGGCARLIGYRLQGIEPSDPPDLPAYWSFGIGSAVHEWWQEALQKAFPDAEIEVKLRIDGLDASGHADALVRHEDRSVSVLELKTINGFGYKTAIGEKYTAKGPRWSSVVQAALNGLAADADEIVVVYLSLEAVSRQAAKKNDIGEVMRVAAEWTYPRELYVPIAEAEVRRWQSLLEGVDAGRKPKRKIPDPELPAGAVVTDPTKGAWAVYDDEGNVLQVGTTWHCQYCSHQTHCSNDD